MTVKNPGDTFIPLKPQSGAPVKGDPSHPMGPKKPLHGTGISNGSAIRSTQTQAQQIPSDDDDGIAERDADDEP